MFVKRLEDAKDLPLPSYQTKFAAGMDLYANNPDTWRLLPGVRVLVPCGIAIQIPIDCEAQIRPRSGLALKYGVTVLNSPGTIDADYRGELGVILINHSSQPFIINRGDRIAQLVISPIRRVDWTETEDLTSSERGDGGFGHTG